MSGEHGHYVATRKQTEQMINRRSQFWISDCGCRKARGGKCRRSRMDVCLSVYDPGPKGASGGGDTKKVSRRFVTGVLKEAEEKHLICQPFRYGRAVGVCFCCDDCCFLFNPKLVPCQKGSLVEKTDMDACINCGKCVKVCWFGARAMKRNKLHVNPKLCSGCGLCTDVCPVDGCITMVKRPSAAHAH